MKVYAAKDDHRYSPGEVVGAEKAPCWGNPDPDKLCMSQADRHNLSMRTQNRHLTRLTNAYSKQFSNRQAALELYFAVYNFVRPHGTLNKAAGQKPNPATAAGLTHHPWPLMELLGDFNALMANYRLSLPRLTQIGCEWRASALCQSL